VELIMMYTRSYRKHYIHCRVDGGRERCRVQGPRGSTIVSDVSFATAKKKIRARTRTRR
jgi:hypothetical protein